MVRIKKTIGTGLSERIKSCQICNSVDLLNFADLGYHPTVNDFIAFDSKPSTIEYYPLDLFYCPECSLVQIATIVDPKKIFPKNYAYRSGTTNILIDNFKDLAKKASNLINFKSTDLVIDIGSNDGTLLQNFKKLNLRILGVEPTDVATLAIKNGIETYNNLFNEESSLEIQKVYGKARLITAANVFAHIEDIHGVVRGIKNLLDSDGIFISENHYLGSLIDTLQYDTIYHEHLRHYSLKSLSALFAMHDLEIFHAEKIPTHGGSIRVFSCKQGLREKTETYLKLLNEEPKNEDEKKIIEMFDQRVRFSRIEILFALLKIKLQNKTIAGISAPSRASTLINYLGLNNQIIDYICEVDHSLKLNKCIPGTNIPVVSEKKLYVEQPDYAFLFSWHIADELIPKLRKNGYKGKFIIPLPELKFFD